MKNKITMTQMMAGTKALRVEGEHFTHIGVGPMSYNLLRAALELAKEKEQTEGAEPPPEMVTHKNGTVTVDGGLGRKVFLDRAVQGFYLILDTAIEMGEV